MNEKRAAPSTSKGNLAKKDKKDDAKKEKDDDKQDIDSELDDPIIKELFSGLEGAAFQSRMPFDKLTSTEAACFPGQCFTAKNLFYLINNSINYYCRYC